MRPEYPGNEIDAGVLCVEGVEIGVRGTHVRKATIREPRIDKTAYHIAKSERVLHNNASSASNRTGEELSHISVGRFDFEDEKAAFDFHKAEHRFGLSIFVPFQVALGTRRIGDCGDDSGISS